MFTLQKVQLIQSLMAAKSVTSAWTGARDETGSGKYEFVGSGGEVPVGLWMSGPPGPVGHYVYQFSDKLYTGRCDISWTRRLLDIPIKQLNFWIKVENCKDKSICM